MVELDVVVGERWPAGRIAAPAAEERVARAVRAEDRLMAVRNDFEFAQGEHVRLRFTLNPAALVRDWHIALVARRNAGDAEVALHVDRHTMTQAAGFQLDIPAAETARLAPDTYAYDVWRTDAGEERLLTTGVLTVRQAVYRGAGGTGR